MSTPFVVLRICRASDWFTTDDFDLLPRDLPCYRIGYDDRIHGDFGIFQNPQATLSDRMVFTDAEIRKNGLKYLDNEMGNIAAATLLAEIVIFL